MEFLSALKEIVSVILVCNAVTGKEDKSMTESYVDKLNTVLVETPSYLIKSNGNKLK